MLAAAVTSSPTYGKRQSPLPTKPVVLRSDLKGVQEGQPGAFKNQILSLTEDGAEITFIDQCQIDLAAGALITPEGIALTVNNTASGGSIVTKMMDIEANSETPGALQKVVLLPSGAPNDQGTFRTDDIELRVQDTSPVFDTWVICPGTSQPTLSWLGIQPPTAQFPGGLVSLPPYPCSAVRLFAESFENMQERVKNECGGEQ
ncbi:MAG: hypothetical protein Q9169_001923 [Polycauliona sp. 2 TL-2023]